ncbi:type VI secretion system baseplate subunit TssF [Agrobacterium vitis]|uniref:type VI secretion system baseplate subunit TssF n=1 Tax=Rhizobium/Agrobacterium group TaxID=227290 RepID=UPI0008DC2614|nr:MULTISPECIES: type VI secretion system baseplate subunit TssF [Rhizobium/Agrobacterium group]MCF1432257.1 type VI secretion system baseplate subunit TssF [Allorhizobium ampelinum]MUO88207.1 type VI secretion system baseplate subunit TssF [Agrobacterium vitis]MUZ50664.1 type VI secretion system baseplate subunit TssF [Agrobacterium vitis]MUZ91008.1 type VI secretion system baseplate subunit TssF [Agrobacterium vitis]MVA38955.1 type VI secretion system baseplate subunit TssF [Agrobacterium vi
MAETFLERYNDELFALRRRAEKFARAFPKIAGRLRLSGDVADDPHVERIIQSFAYSAARVRQKLDDEFPELTDSLLETLYPHYLAPVPPMSIVQFAPGATLAGMQLLPRHTDIVTEPVGGDPCQFRTTQDVEIVPMTVSNASLTGLPLDAPATPFAGAAGVLRLSLRSTAPKQDSMAGLGVKRLTFFIASAWAQAAALFELLANHCIGMALARHSEDRNAVFLAAENLRPLGFAPEQAMLPTAPGSFAGYRLLTEFFTLPQKFLFLEVSGMDRWQGDDVELYIYLDSSDARLERMISASDIVLNATPVINLFRQSSEPLTLDGSRTEYSLLPDSRRQTTREIYMVEQVRLSAASGEEQDARPFFGSSQRGANSSVFWQAVRRFDEDDGSSDTQIAFVDRNRGPLEPTGLTASVDTLCLNRDLASQLPFGGGHPHLQLVKRSESVAEIKALLPPTPAIRIHEKLARQWRLVSHLLLNHLSLFDNDGSALKDILSLYALRDAPETRQLVEAISRVEAKHALARLGPAMVPGTDVKIEFDPAMIDRAAAFIFGSIIDHFCGLYTSVNSFTRLTLTMRGQSEPIVRWPARAAERPLL